MGQFYIDESIHDKAGFIIGACVYTENDLNEKIIEIIKSNGLDPDLFEFKSNTNYSKEPEKVQLREQLKVLLSEKCSLGIVILPRTSREQLGFECIKAVKQFIDNNEIIKKPVSIYIDQGMFTPKDNVDQFISSINFTDCIFHLEQNSLTIKGIQLSDLAAHISSIQLKDAMGLVTKIVKGKKSSSNEPDYEIELGFEMWETIRYTFFNEVSKVFTDDPIEDATLKVEPYGLYISELCDKSLSDIARAKFGDIYLGCIH